MEFLAAAWRQIGLDIEINSTTYNQFQDKVRRGAYQIFIWGWVADFPDPENFFFLLECQNARSKSGGPNTADFCDAEFDRLYHEMKYRPNDEHRADLIRRMRAILERERPWIELYHREDFVLSHAWLVNSKPMGISHPAYKYKDVRPQLRAQLRAEWNAPVRWPLYLVLILVVAATVPAVQDLLPGAPVMAAYLLRRVGYGFLTVLGVLFLLFVLFFAVTNPDDIARKAVGERARPEVYAQWKINHGYDKPLFLNRDFAGSDSRRYTDTLLAEHYRRMLTFDFGRSDADDSPIARRLWDGAGPSLSLTVPLFVLGLVAGHCAGPVRRLLPRDLHRSRRARAVHADDERGVPALHHCRAIPRRHAAQMVPDLGLRSQPGGGRRASSLCRCWSAWCPASARTCASCAPSSSRR